MLFFLSSGLFLGWSLGANDAANVFGTAVGTKMIKFKLAALIASVFVLLGAVLEGSGATETLGELGAINALAGAFAVAFAAGLTVTVMTRLRLPVSTSQAVVGAIIGWNIFSGSATDMSSLTKIVLTWILCPILAAVFAIAIYFPTKHVLENSKIHLLTMDAYTRLALIIVGAFGAYSLGANNIANVMGVFVTSSPFRDIHIGESFTFSSAQQLFLLGGIAISIGIYSYSYKVMRTVGRDLFRLSPVTAFIVVLSHSLVLYVFASENLRNFIMTHGLPPIPLVPVSSSQAVIGAILGIAIAKGGRNIQFGLLGRISSGWAITPVISGLVSFIMLFFVQNVFDQNVYHETLYSFHDMVIEKMAEDNVDTPLLSQLAGMEFANVRRLNRYMNNLGIHDPELRATIRKYSAARDIEISQLLLRELNPELFTPKQLIALNSLKGEQYEFIWEFHQALEDKTDEWKLRANEPENNDYNRELTRLKDYLSEYFAVRKL